MEVLRVLFSMAFPWLVSLRAPTEEARAWTQLGNAQALHFTRARDAMPPDGQRGLSHPWPRGIARPPAHAWFHGREPNAGAASHRLPEYKCATSDVHRRR